MEHHGSHCIRNETGQVVVAEIKKEALRKLAGKLVTVSEEEQKSSGGRGDPSEKLLLNDSGSVPVSWLSKTIKPVSAFPSQRCSGSSPVNILSSTSKLHSLEYFPISGGRTPSSLLLKSLMSHKFGRRPMIAGILPERLL
ncbi:hypothetical protein M5K25_003395 [Dendrobium thyrsiflorum]|uniref:Uncharacterized protein n=1 Tax=Dendrobium thyrsiflorum TaxID=117978 RepID=A0ABD0VRF2_DENTH